MGVPAFFRWLSRKYPSVIIDCVEDTRFNTEEGTKVPVDATKPNPNGVEFDNLYLDMNGIIHPCTHPEDKPPPKDEDEMMVAIFECIDRIFTIVRPRKLLYMAIDGVAPRAKMNQQRSRRFRASKEALEKKIEVARLRKELQEKGFKVPPEKPKESHFDSNCITPGTPFMDRLSKCLHYYVHERLNTDPAWRNIKVILSDANVPGEGEHKIMDYIRRQRAQPDHDPDTHHVLCGADADLIMLGLATHEVNFTIIREEFKPNKPRPCDVCGRLGHEMVDCLGVEGEGDEGEPEKVYEEQRYIFVRLNVLREYLERELGMPGLPFKYDFDRAIDDWVFMCFFVGNDFLPHLPSLEIRENAIDRLINLYKDCCFKTGGWLTDSGSANMRRVQMILQNLGKVEDQIFKTRQKRELDFRARNKAQKRQQQMEKEAARQFLNQTGQGALGVMRAGETAVAHGAKGAILDQRFANMNQGRGVKRSHEEEEEEETPDEVRLYEDGFKDRYYESKFEVTKENLGFRKRVADEYARGLCWVLKYYYQGCVSWNWYFPYHYAPFASDFDNCANANVKFDLGEPFNPLEQLMGVFPAASRSHVPDPWGELMLKPDSNIIDFYPEDFKIDLNGKKFAWQGVALLPFVDEVRLKKALKEVYPLLTSEEKRRNKRGDSRLYIGCKHNAYNQLCDMYRMGMTYETEVPVGGTDYQGMQGRILLANDNVEPNGVLPAPIGGLPDIKDNQVITIRYRDPSYPKDFIFPARKLENAEDPPRVLKSEQLAGGEPGSYRPKIGFNPNLPHASLDMSGHRTLGHLMPNPEAEEQGGKGLLPTPVQNPLPRSFSNNNNMPNVTPNLLAGGMNNEKLPLLQGERAGKGLLGIAPRGGGLLPTPHASAAPPLPLLSPSQSSPGNMLGSLGIIGALLGSGLGSSSAQMSTSAGSRGGHLGPGQAGQGRPKVGLLGSGCDDHTNSSLPMMGANNAPFRNGKGRGSIGIVTRQENFPENRPQQDGLLGACPRGSSDWENRPAVGFPNPNTQSSHSKSSRVKTGLLDFPKDDRYCESDFNDNSLLRPCFHPRAPYKPSSEGNGLLGEAPSDFGGYSYSAGGEIRDDSYKCQGDFEGRFHGEAYDSGMGHGGLLGDAPEMSHHMNRGRGGGGGHGQYGNVPPPRGMGHNRGMMRGGGRGGNGGSLLGTPPGNFQMMSQTANYQGYGGGQGGRFNQNKSHGGDGGYSGGYNGPKQSGYHSNHWQNQGSRGGGGGGGNFNPRGGGGQNNYNSRGGGGGYRGNKRGRGNSGYFSTGSGY